MSRSSRIGVIGGGASAVSLLDALSRREEVPESVTVFEPGPHLWRGRAYQPDSTTLRVNVPPDDMSLCFGDTHHFENWVGTRSRVLGDPDTDYLDPYAAIPFLPRAVYGDYLEQTARTALTRLAGRGCRIEQVREGVVAADPSEDLLRLRTDRGDVRTVDYAVLCVGGGRPADPYGLTGAPGFVPDPYPVVCRLDGIARDADVAVIGSGLTAADVVLTLANWGHRGRITLLSRRGVLPAVRQRPVEHRLRHFTPAHFRDLAARGGTRTLPQTVEVMRAEIADAGADWDALVEEISGAGTEHPVGRMRRHLSGVHDSDLGLRILQRAVPDTGPDVWPLLPEADRSALIRDHYRTIMSLCCPMPPAGATALLELIDGGRLEIVRGVERVTAEPGGGFLARTAGGDRPADVVVNAVNAPAHRIPPKAEGLIGSLVAAGMAARHPRGGVHVERATSRLVAGGRTWPRLYALGELASGSLFFTFGVPSLVDRAYDIAEAVSRHAGTGAVRDGDDVMQTA
ncbi:FAD/NAD(P)-binding protein [Streptomyces sp. SP18CS02]|uniref:FAD/NAD(P)-binding protein n=1 Tax=Streptomyces sp. SP18CS02 TaxID=3002531 RepID=UPI002E7756DB|nr:FAD/NAD(P)-binding protein [Streptomyces sp. SP18CS02]MEE1757276.1 FAD/NAD(P)-binding protein [Streptomyces sp. SP18CS02]